MCTRLVFCMKRMATKIRFVVLLNSFLCKGMFAKRLEKCKIPWMDVPPEKGVFARKQYPYIGTKMCILDMKKAISSVFYVFSS